MEKYKNFDRITVHCPGAEISEEARTNLSLYSKSEADQEIKDTLSEIPSNQGTYTLKVIDGILGWTE